MIRIARPLLIDVALVLACSVAMFTEQALRNLPPSPAAGAMFVVTSLPVLLRRQAPSGSLVLAFVALFGLAELDVDIYSTIGFPAVLCAYTLADRYGRRAALISAPIAAGLTIAILQIYSPHVLFSWSTVQNLALVVLPLALGVAAHDHRAWREVMVERAQAAERNQEEIARRRVSDERLRIARDVHDVVAHALVTINVQAGVGAFLVRTDPDEAHLALRTIKQVSGDALGDLRATLGVIRSPQGIDTLGDLAESLRTAGLQITLDVKTEEGLPTSVDSTAYRIVQESLTNTLKHAGRTSARITVAQQEGRLLIEITDDGGTPTEQQLSVSGSGNGLRGMRERAAALGGSLEAGPGPDGGWRVTAELPLSSPLEVPAT
ncbi:sensor histidine kinase [Kineosporia babensis]|uniref:histidine kinase n=1 Tax=Kineosporia babensis TaxID=499548 RepID=A0A9X1NBJ9_9ACTN|nr:histidine kinase [Kineosporia babensis]